jgi:hypothetical protein
VLACCLWVLTASVLSGSGGDAPAYRIPRVDTPPSLDGLVDEAVWNRAWKAELPYEVSPADNTPAPVRTEVLVMYDQSDLYVGMRAYDPDPTAIRAHLADRDDAWSDDWMGVIFDTFNDERRDLLLVVNPLGVQMDTIENWPGGSMEWDAIWESAAQVTAWGWSVELRIPFSSLRFQRSDRPQVWGFDAIRGYPRDRFRQMGAFPRDRNNDCYLCQAIKIEGFEGVSPGHNLEVVPTLTASRTERRAELTQPYGDPDDTVEAGATAAWGFTPNMTLGATLNPDFSQVEADARQLDVNEPFALFFAEKRPFFMEAADFFMTPLQAVYTRMVRDPEWGLKLTGKEGANTIGAYVVEDQITNLVFPGAQGSAATTLGRSTTAAVGRYKRDFGNRFTLGLLVTDRQGDDYHNRVGGFDFDFRLSEQDRVQVQVLGSATRYPDEVSADFGQPSGEFTDLAAELYYTRSARNLSIWAEGTYLGEGFRADLGFMPRVNLRGGQVGISYDWIGTDATWYSLLNLKAKLERLDDQSGGLLFEEEAVQFTANGPMQSQMVVRVAGGREGYAGRVFSAETLVLKGAIKPDAHTEIVLYIRAGDRVDYANARQGKRLQLNPLFVVHAGRHLRLEGSYVWEQMEIDAGRLYTANVSDLTTAWHFSPRAFVRAILQYVDYDFASELYQDGRERRFRQLFSQLLYAYELNPRTVLFVGYSDNSFDQQDLGLTRADRTVFAKVGYAWVL